MKKKYIAPSTFAVQLALEDAVLAASGPTVGMDETGTTVDNALTNQKNPWGSTLWDDYVEE